MPDLKLELLRIIDRKLLYPLFQPIVSVNQKQIIGYQALIRGPSDSPLHSPLDLFDAAQRHHQLGALESLCHEVCVNSFIDLDITGKLFLKAHPSVLHQGDFKKSKLQKLIKNRVWS
jgi:EAL domain-containing protein (putative c-di-GMP-specific phosphodiesterase class I)